MKRKEEGEREGNYILEKLISGTLTTHLCYPDFVLSVGIRHLEEPRTPTSCQSRCHVASLAGETYMRF